MSIDPTILPVLSYWVKQQKEAERDKQRATEDGKLWLRRAKLAMNKGDQELAQLASEQAFEARNRFRKAEGRLFIIEQEKELLKAGARNHTAAYREAERRTQHAIAEFAKLGIDADFAALEYGTMSESDDDLQERDVFARLRARMDADQRRNLAEAASPAATAQAAPSAPATAPVATPDPVPTASTEPLGSDVAMDEELRALLDEIETLHEDPGA